MQRKARRGRRGSSRCFVLSYFYPPYTAFPSHSDASSLAVSCVGRKFYARPKFWQAPVSRNCLMRLRLLSRSEFLLGQFCIELLLFFGYVLFVADWIDEGVCASVFQERIFFL